MHLPKPPLEFEHVWKYLLEFAQTCIDEKRPIFTLQRQVKNYITDIKPTSIGRWSEQGRSDDRQSRVTRGQAQQCWDHLCGRRRDFPGLYFVPAFMHAALKDHIIHLGGKEIALRHSNRTHKIMTERKKRAIGFASGGEGPEHRSIRLAIYERPNEILTGLQGGPFTSHETEFTFETGDRVDVVLRDEAGKFLLVEVKPWIEEHDLAPFAQVAKYRTLWHILVGTPLEEIRCLVVAPTVPRKVAGRMLREQRIETLIAKVPQNPQHYQSTQNSKQPIPSKTLKQA